MRDHLFEVIVTQVRQLTPRIREYLLADPEGRALPEYAPGAHLELHTVSDVSGPIIRHYSLVGGQMLVDDAADTYRIAVQREDRARGSAHIHDMFEVGTRLRVSRPRNNFPLAHTDSHSLLIAGGIGITPILSMLRSLVRRRRSFQMVYSGRTAEDQAYREDIAALGGEAVRMHLSGNPPTDHVDLKSLLATQPAGTTVYACGPQPMIAAIYAAAKALGWNPERVRSELFTVGPTGDEQPFQVELARTGRSITVGRDTTILDALTAAGVDTLSDCRRGECGLCPITVLDADGELQHRDRYLSDAARASGKTLCICVSRLKGERLVLDA